MLSQLSETDEPESSENTLTIPVNRTLDLTEDDNETYFSPKSESEDNNTTDGEFFDFAESYIALDEEINQTMTKGQKRQLEKDISEVRAHDQCPWSTLKSEKNSKPLPRGCRTFLMEIFAGAAFLSSMASGMGFEVSAPVDIVLDESNLLDPKVRHQLEAEIIKDDPYILTFAPICGPWSQWQKLNCSRSPQTAEKLLDERDLWYPTLKWICKIIKGRLRKGRKVLVENPCHSQLWETLCFDKLLQEELYDEETGNYLELVRGDQCQFGLIDSTNGFLHLKPTGFVTASDPVKQLLSKRCSGDRVHSPLEGGQRTKRAQVWPRQPCQAILKGFIMELEERSLHAAFGGEFEAEMEEKLHPLGQLDAIYDEKGISNHFTTVYTTPEEELQRLESMEERNDLPDSSSLEATRRNKWLKASRATRVALRQLHTMTGHCSTSSMISMLRTAGAAGSTIEAARHFACEVCKKTQNVQTADRVKPPNKPTFNFEISCDAFEIKDSSGNRHTVLCVVDLGFLFHQAFWVAPGGVPRSSVCAQALRDGWVQWTGPPKQCLLDRGAHNRDKFVELLNAHGIDIRFGGLEAPFQLGRTERQGGILKRILKPVIQDKQVIGVEEIKMVIAEAVTIKNNRLHHQGFTPSQCVLGRLPREVCSLTAHDDDLDHWSILESIKA